MNQPAADALVGAPPPAGEWFGHPRQLARLFTTEMWERFGYYGMRALLVLFFVDHFQLSDATAAGLYGGFTALVYLTPLLGGLLADRYLGSKASVKLGAILMAAGYLGLCFNGPTAKPFLEVGGQRYAVDVVKAGGETTRSLVLPAGGKVAIKGNADGSLSLAGDSAGALPARLEKGTYKADADRSPLFIVALLMSLSAIIVGNGFFKPNISTIVGSLYGASDVRRDAGFTIFYMGINVGSTMSLILVPTLAQLFGWWAGFGLAAAGMLIAWLLFQFDGGRLDGYGEPPAAAPKRAGLWIALASVLAVPLIYVLLNNTMLTAETAAAAAKGGGGVWAYIISLPLLGKIMGAVFVAAVIGIPIWAAMNGTRAEWQMMTVAVVLTVFSTVFWTLFEQAGSSLTLFADRNTNRSLFGLFTVPAGTVQIFNPGFVILLAPIFSIVWVRLAKRRLEPSTPLKFVIALALVGLGFLALVFGTRFADAGWQVPLFWLGLAYFLHTAGELCLSPVGLSMITRLSIARTVGLMMGVWFLSSAMAQYVGGIVAQFASVETVGGQVTNPRLSLETYASVFQTIGLASVAAAGLLLLLTPLLKRMMHGVR